MTDVVKRKGNLPGSHEREAVTEVIGETTAGGTTTETEEE